MPKMEKTVEEYIFKHAALPDRARFSRTGYYDPCIYYLGAWNSLSPGVHSNDVWVEVCRRGLETLTLFKTKIFHFATLFKTRSYSLKLTRLVYPTDFNNFPTKIIWKKKLLVPQI